MTKHPTNSTCPDTIEEKGRKSSAEKKPWVFTKFPNVRWFKVSIQGWDKEFLDHGIPKRFEPVMEYEKYSNGFLNSYVRNQTRRLYSLVKNPKAFWRVARYLMKKSIIFRVNALYHIYPRWHRKQTMTGIFNILREYEKNSTSRFNNTKLSESLYSQAKWKVKTFRGAYPPLTYVPTSMSMYVKHFYTHASTTKSTRICTRKININCLKSYTEWSNKLTRYIWIWFKKFLPSSWLNAG